MSATLCSLSSPLPLLRRLFPTTLLPLPSLHLVRDGVCSEVVPSGNLTPPRPSHPAFLQRCLFTCCFPFWPRAWWGQGPCLIHSSVPSIRHRAPSHKGQLVLGARQTTLRWKLQDRLLDTRGHCGHWNPGLLLALARPTQAGAGKRQAGNHGNSTPGSCSSLALGLTDKGPGPSLPIYLLPPFQTISHDSPIPLQIQLCAQLLSHVQFSVTSETVSLQAPLPMGLPRREYLSGLPFSPPEHLPDSGIESSLCHLHWQVDSLPLEPPGNSTDTAIVLHKCRYQMLLPQPWHTFWLCLQNAPLHLTPPPSLTSSVAQLCPTLRPHGLQQARPPCPSPTPGA